MTSFLSPELNKMFLVQLFRLLTYRLEGRPSPIIFPSVVLNNNCFKTLLYLWSTNMLWVIVTIGRISLKHSKKGLNISWRKDSHISINSPSHSIVNNRMHVYIYERCNRRNRFLFHVTCLVALRSLVTNHFYPS